MPKAEWHPLSYHQQPPAGNCLSQAPIVMQQAWSPTQHAWPSHSEITRPKCHLQNDTCCFLDFTCPINLQQEHTVILISTSDLTLYTKHIFFSLSLSANFPSNLTKQLVSTLSRDTDQDMVRCRKEDAKSPSTCSPVAAPKSAVHGLCLPTLQAHVNTCTFWLGNGDFCKAAFL